MNIRINGVPISFELEQEQTAGEVYDGVAQWLHSAGHSLERVVLNEEDVTDREGSWRNTPVDAVSTLDIDARSIREQQIEDLETIIHYVELLRRVLGEGDESQRSAVMDELPHVSAGIRRNAPDLAGLLEEPLNNGELSDEGVRETAITRATEIIQLLEGRQRELLDPDHEMRNTLDVLDSILPTFEEIPGQIQGGQRGQAMEVVARFSELVSRELRIIPLTLEIHPPLKEEVIDGEPIGEALRQLNEFFSEMEGAFVNEDFVLLGDLLEYEMLPRFTALNAALRRHVAPET